ncbi:MAG: 16S rRNA (adenine(1518)-N(6)/adenine(1519)-N(6))-dimethyltransferase RsmA [Magnetococcales bacterium]|nr:16S rRNA (adenine(1518)-N(6)/adenine(1519)-N(6))-dimethyltransferase RsmA [Magnetococcales bacterium]
MANSFLSAPLPKKRMGQHFLNDPQIAQAIVDGSGVSPDDRVIEIGPGLGSLTQPLLKRVGKVWAIELDLELVPLLLQRTAGLGELHVEQVDALRVNFQELAHHLGGSLRIVANLPYNVSTPLLLQFIKYRESIEEMTLMFQTEVAERIAAAPGTKAYGTLSVLCGLWMQSEIILTVPPSAFRPPPKVTSAVLRLLRRPTPLAEVRDPETFSHVVRAAFGQRRKILSNALRIMHSSPLEWLQRAEIDPERRGETLSIAEFARLANAVDFID